MATTAASTNPALVGYAASVQSACPKTHPRKASTILEESGSSSFIEFPAPPAHGSMKIACEPPQNRRYSSSYNGIRSNPIWGTLSVQEINSITQQQSQPRHELIAIHTNNKTVIDRWKSIPMVDEDDDDVCIIETHRGCLENVGSRGWIA
jgi:hypothetical protein